MKTEFITDSLSIRQASIADLQQLKEVGTAAYGQYADILGEDNWAIMRRNLNNEAILTDLLSSATCFVASHNDKIVGMAFLIASGKATDTYQEDWCSIRLVAVDPQYKGRQIAKTLTQKCIQRAIENGEKTIALHTSRMMPAAMHIYESFGFKMVKELGLRYDQEYLLYTMDISAKTLAP